MDSTCDTASVAALMRAGDLEALDRFTRCWGPRLVAVARRSCRLDDDAEDAVQDALVEASRAMTSFRGEGSPLAWLSTLVVRRCHRLGRGARHDPCLHTHEVEVACACDSPEGLAEGAELGARLTRALLGLGELDRRVVLLADEGLTGPEIAAELGISADGVRGRLKRARARLRAELEDLIAT